MVEEKIYQYLVGLTSDYEGLLTTYNGAPAVFLQEAPSDTDKGWKKGEQYGRLVFGLDYSGDPERAVQASLWLDYYATKTGPTPEEASDYLLSILNNMFFSDASETIALAWRSTGNFQETKNDAQINGVTINFDVLYFPSQRTTTPDPVVAINTWTKGVFPSAYVIGVDELPDSWSPTENPTIYWRIASIAQGTLYPDTYNCTWHDVTLSGHFMMDDSSVRQAVCKSIIDRLSAAGRVMMDDGSPMFILRDTYSSSADSIKNGQITVVGCYGVLREYPTVDILEVINKGVIIND